MATGPSGTETSEKNASLIEVHLDLTNHSKCETARLPERSGEETPVHLTQRVWPRLSAVRSDRPVSLKAIATGVLLKPSQRRGCRVGHLRRFAAPPAGTTEGSRPARVFRRV